MTFWKKKSLYVFFTITILLLLILIKFLYDYSTVNINWLKFNSLIGWFTLIWSILSWKSLRNEVISLYITYLLLLYLFTFGQSLLVLFNLVHESNDLLNRFTTSELINAQFFTLFSLVSFHLGALIFCKKSISKEITMYNHVTSVDSNMIKAIKYTGIILFTISFPAFIYKIISTVKFVIENGYFALFGYHNGNLPSKNIIEKIFEETAIYFIPSLICLLIVYRNNKNILTLLYLILSLYILINFYIGGRGGAVLIILTLILLHHYTVKQLNKKNVLSLTIFSYLLISFLSIIQNFRNVANRSILDYIYAFLDSFGKENLFVQTISEIGWTMFPLVAVMQIIPSYYDYFYGKSYLFALTSVIPNLGFWDLHPAKIYAGGSEWLMDALNLWSGPAFTLIADAYRNFGWIGFFILIVFGAMFSRIYSSINKYSILVKPEIICVVMIFFQQTVMSVRGDNLYIIRPLFFVVIPIYLLIKILHKELSKKKIC